MHKILLALLVFATTGFAQLEVVDGKSPQLHNRYASDTVRGIWVAARITDTRLPAFWQAQLNVSDANDNQNKARILMPSKGDETSALQLMSALAIKPGAFVSLQHFMNDDENGFCFEFVETENGDLVRAKRFENVLQTNDSLDLYLTFAWTTGPKSRWQWDPSIPIDPWTDTAFQKTEWKTRTSFRACATQVPERIVPKSKGSLGRITPLSNGWSVPQGKWTLRNLQGAEIPMRTEVSGDRLEVRPANGKRGAFVLQNREQAVPVVLP